MSSSHLQQMLDFIDENFLSINSIVIVRNGYVVLEQYYGFFNENFSMNIFSCTKTITSILVGIAIDLGFIENTSLRILPFFEGRTIENMNNWKESITIEDLLTMRAGFDWDDNSDSGVSEYNQMLRSDNWVQYVLDRPMAFAPGTVFNYNTGASLLLSAIIQNVTGMTAEEFAEEHLMGPLGISDFSWREDPQGISIGGNTIQLRPRDMARIGYLLLRNGSWNGEQIVSSSYVQMATETHTMTGGQFGYGYQIWTRDGMGYYQALGYAGQYIIVSPKYDLVVVFSATTGWYNTAMEDWIIPSILEYQPGSAIPVDMLGVAVTVSIISVVAISSAYFFVKRSRK
ncbi:MAG: serine hydrolase domain-containing protein [Candidatus Thorarchaeota archaeon]